MAGKKGRSGRPKGSPNKITAEIRSAIQSHDPVGQLFRIVDNSEDDDLKVKALLGVMRYGYPALAATSVDLKAALRGDVTLHLHPPDDAGSD